MDSLRRGILARASLRWWMGIVIGVAVVLRLVAVVYLGDDVTPEPGIYDQVSYDGLARRLLSGHGFSFGEASWPATAANAPTAHWSYLYTLYLTGVYAVCGEHPLAARIIQAVATGVLMPWLTFRLGRRAFGSAAGLAAASVTAVYVYFVYYGASLMTEAFYMVGILWVFEIAGGLAEKHASSTGQPERGKALLAFGTLSPRVAWPLLGLAMGTTVLLRQVFMPVAALVIAWLWWAAPGRRRMVVRGALAAISVMGLLILPWTLRNYRAFGRFVLLNTNAGFAFYWANHPIHGTTHTGLLPPEISYQSLIPPELAGLDEAALEKELMARGVRFVRDDPGRWLLLSVNRIKEQFKFWPSRDSGLISNVSRVGSFGLFLPFMVAGGVAALRGRRGKKTFTPGPSPSGRGEMSRWARLVVWSRTEVALWLAFAAGYTLMHLVSWAGVRYRLPTDSVMVLFAGLALARSSEWLGRLRQARQGARPL